MRTKEEITEEINSVINSKAWFEKELGRLNIELSEIKKKHKWALSYDYLLNNSISESENYLCKHVYINEAHYHKLEALRKLQLLRHEIVGGWVPDWTSNKEKYVVYLKSNKIIKDCYSYSFFEFSFETIEQSDWFFDKHIDLLKVYYGITELPKP